VIRSFRGKQTRALWERKRNKAAPPNLQREALRKLTEVNNAQELGDLRVPPGNRLEKLSGDRDGRYSVRINDQYRVCFVWQDGDAHDVEITDYH
jgi:proteic killer suppression protein